MRKPETIPDRGGSSVGEGVRPLALPGDVVGISGGNRDQPAAQRNAWAVVLAGGEGTRLRAFVREVLGSERPKQFCRIIGTRSMLRHTWDRAARVVAPERIVTVITAGHERFLAEEARHGVPGTVLVQPGGRGTAPGILLPLMWIARHDPQAVVAVFPADHFVWKEECFARHVQEGLAAAEYWPRRLILLGVEAEGPEPGYGWIAAGSAVGGPSAPELYAVRRFWEKPDRPTALRFFRAGSFWNTLVLAGCLEAYLRLAAVELPDVLAPLRVALECMGTPAEATALRASYARIPPTNLSQALLARRPQDLMMLAVRGVCWSDWGEPARILRTLHRFDFCPRWLRTPAQAPLPATARA